jgi:hypothetical protein
MAGMFGGYVALGKIAKQLFQESLNFLPDTFTQDLKEYQKLRIYTILSNDCYQEIVSIPCNILLIQAGVIFGASLIESTLRSTANQFEMFFVVDVVANIYCYIIVAYSIPGLVNSISTMIIRRWKQNFTEFFTVTLWSRSKLKEYRRYVKACPGIRIMFGAGNFYEKTTWIHILNLVITYTINSVLLV